MYTVQVISFIQLYVIFSQQLLPCLCLCTFRFGLHAQSRIVQWLEKNVDKAAAVVDIGCGNGALLVSLVRSPHSGEMDPFYLSTCLSVPLNQALQYGDLDCYQCSFMFLANRLKRDL